MSFDNNLSHKLVKQFEDIFPNSTHIRICGSIEGSEIVSFIKEPSLDCLILEY